MLYQQHTALARPLAGHRSSLSARRPLVNGTLSRTQASDKDGPRADAQNWGQLSALVDKALAKDPDLRYRSAGELAQDLRTLQAGGRVPGLGAVPGNKRLRWAAAAAVLAFATGLAFVIAPLHRAGGSSPPSLSAHRNLAILPPVCCRHRPAS